MITTGQSRSSLPCSHSRPIRVIIRLTNWKANKRTKKLLFVYTTVKREPFNFIVFHHWISMFIKIVSSNKKHIILSICLIILNLLIKIKRLENNMHLWTKIIKKNLEELFSFFASFWHIIFLSKFKLKVSYILHAVCLKYSGRKYSLNTITKFTKREGILFITFTNVFLCETFLIYYTYISI